MTREYRLRQDRSRKSGHAHQKNTQDFPALRLNTAERAATKFCELAQWMSQPGSAYYDALPPAAQMATRAVLDAAKMLRGGAR